MKKPFTSLFVCLLVLAAQVSLAQIPRLSSLPTATATIFLDFDGHVVSTPLWNGGTTINCAAAGMNSTQITEVYNRVAEDYRPFAVNITTDPDRFAAAPLNQRMRIIITPTSSWYQGVGGVAYIGSFTWGDDTPGFVFSDRLGPNSPKMVAECVSHEAGHTVGLAHQARYDENCNLTAVYHDGFGVGETGWAPIMGNSYYRNMSGWNHGPTPYGCANVQDNLSTITTQNGFGFRTDDFGEDLNGSVTNFTPNPVGIDGVISTPTDKDAFRFSLTQSTNFRLEVRPFSVQLNSEGANLDVKVMLYNQSRQLIRTYDPLNTMAVVIDTILTSGNYFVMVAGAGNSNTDNYGSLGSYKMTGLLGTLPIRDVRLQGRLDANQRHQLNWQIEADEAIRDVVIEVSTDGQRFTSLNTLDGRASQFAYVPFRAQDLFYRLKVTSVINQTVYSNTVSLRATGRTGKAFQVSTLVTSQISVQASNDFRYVLMDIRGTQLERGIGKAGFTSIATNRIPAGVYVLRIESDQEMITERIVKQ